MFGYRLYGTEYMSVCNMKKKWCNGINYFSPWGLRLVSVIRAPWPTYFFLGPFAEYGIVGSDAWNDDFGSKILARKQLDQIPV